MKSFIRFIFLLQSDSYVCKRKFTTYIKVERKVDMFVISGKLFQCRNFHNKCVLSSLTCNKDMIECALQH